MSTLTHDLSPPQSDEDALTAKQMQQAEELLFSEPAARRFREGPFSW